MISKSIENKIAALSPKARKLFLLKLKESINTASAQNKSSKRKRIVAYIKGNEGFSLDELKTNLKKKLPDYMVPSQFISVESIPLLPNGKIDRKQLSKINVPVVKTKIATTNTTKNSIEKDLISIWEEVLGFSPIHKDDNFFEIGGDSILSIQIISKARKAGLILKANDLFEHQTIAALSSIAEVEQKVNTISAEDILIKIWEDTLGFSPIHKDDNFFEIGGDSILSIQIIAKARKAGLILKANDLFEHQTVAELSLFAKTESKQIKNEILEGIIPLSPIQHWFFNDHKNAPEYWNQGVRLDNLQITSEEKIQQVCDYIINQHDSLRLRFTNIDSNWVQSLVSPDKMNALEFVDLTQILSTEFDKIVQDKTQQVQDNFILENGNLFKCIYFSTGISNKDFCVFIAHHLLVDAVSWQIIIADFKTTLEQVSANKQIVIEAKTSSILEWSKHLNNYAENISNDELDFWKSQIKPTPALPFDKENVAIILEKEVENIPFSLDKNTTKELQDANQAYTTKIDELLITAFVNTIGNWSKNKEVAIGFEKHGRETLGKNIDISKTVGWFTSYFPMRFNHTFNENIENSIISVKENLRKITNGGIGYGALRYVEKTFGDVENPEIVFNFLGTKTTSKENIKETTLTKNLRDVCSERHYKLEINLYIIDGELKGTFSYGNNIYSKDTIVRLIENFKNQIKVINDFCNQTENGGYTPSDFADADVSQDDLDNLLNLLE